MGNALLDNRNYNDAIKAYHLAEVLQYKPMAKLLYNTACVYSLKQNDTTALNYLVAAIEFGYNNTNSIFKDKDLEYVRLANSWQFNDRVKNALAGAGDIEKLQWNQFSKEFQKLSLPLTIDMDYAKNLNEGYSISYDFEKYVSEMRDGKFSRDVGLAFYCVGTLKSTNGYKILIYATQDAFYGEDDENTSNNIPTTYYAVSYDNKGTLIDKLEIGGRTKLEAPYKIPTVSDASINVAFMQLNYEKDPKEEGYNNNKIVSSEEIGSEHYSISEDGHFIKS